MCQAILMPARILGAERRLRRGPAAVPLVVSETETGGILVQAGPGTLDIVLTTPPFQGSYVVDPAALALGPVNLVSPVVAGTAAVGQTLTGRPGLWVHDGRLAAPSMGWQWLRNGAPIAGATGMSYVTVAADAGTAISVAETAQDTHAARRAVSAPLSMPAPVSPPPAALLDHTQRAKATGAVATRVFSGLTLGAPAATRDIIVMAAVFGTAGATITSVKVAGIAATRLVQTLSGGSGLLCIGAWLARVPAGATGDVELTSSANTTVQHVGLFRGIGLQPAASVAVALGNAGVAALTVANGRAGGKALAFVANNNGTAFTWTGGTEVYDEDTQTGKFASAALGDVGQDGRASLSATRLSGTGQMAGLMIAL